MTRLLRWLLLLALAGGCALQRGPEAAVPSGPDRYAIPLSAKNADLICADTKPGFQVDYCMTVREFRLLVITVRAIP